jgi:hypothetical protein
METMSDRSIPEFAPFGYTLALRMAQLLKGGRACWYPALLGFLCRVAAAAPRLGQACWACPSLQARGCRSWAACHPWAAARPPLAPPHSTPLTACPCTTRRCPVCPALCTALYVHRTVHHALVPHRVPRTLYRRRCGTGARLAVGAGCGPGAGEAGGLGHPGGWACVVCGWVGERGWWSVVHVCVSGGGGGVCVCVCVYVCARVCMRVCLWV